MLDSTAPITMLPLFSGASDSTEVLVWCNWKVLSTAPFASSRITR